MVYFALLFIPTHYLATIRETIQIIMNLYLNLKNNRVPRGDLRNVWLPTCKEYNYLHVQISDFNLVLAIFFRKLNK